MPTPSNKLYIVGSRGVPASYSGYETLAEEIGTRLVERDVDVCVTCELDRVEPKGPPSYKGIELQYIRAPSNHLRTFIADFKALWWCAQQASPGDVVYLLGYGIGPLLGPPLLRMRQKGVRFWINPDGLEWKRSRWPKPVRWYLRFAEGIVVRWADRIIADAVAIQEYLQSAYELPDSRFSVIEYGAPQAEEDNTRDVESEVKAYLQQEGLVPDQYFMKVARCVPENNLHLLVEAFTDGRIEYPFLLITDRSPDNAYCQKLQAIVERSGCGDQIKIRGPIYDQPFLKQLRRNAYGYLHSHSVGGTNPSLVEAMGEGSFVLALNTVFNREVLEDAALYFEDELESIREVICRAESMSREESQTQREEAQQRVEERYNWGRITDRYQTILCSD